MRKQEGKKSMVEWQDRCCYGLPSFMKRRKSPHSRVHSFRFAAAGKRVGRAPPTPPPRHQKKWVIVIKEKKLLYANGSSTTTTLRGRRRRGTKERTNGQRKGRKRQKGIEVAACQKYGFEETLRLSLLPHLFRKGAHTKSEKTKSEMSILE